MGWILDHDPGWAVRKEGYLLVVLMRSQNPTFVSLYSGAGGMDLGFRTAGMRCLWANDIDADAVATHRAHLGDEIRYGDVDSLRPELSCLGLEPDMIIGGPPCQGFSVAGHMRPDDPRSRHVWTFLDVVREFEPSAFVMENVASLATNRRWAQLRDALIERARTLGYQAEIWLLDASHFGVPQARKRMFLVGSRDGWIRQPTATTHTHPRTVREVLEGLPHFGAAGNDGVCVAKVTPARRPVLRRSPYAGMLFNGKGRSLNLDSAAPTLPASMGGNRTPVLDQALLDGQATRNWIEEYHADLMSGGKPIDRIPNRMRRLTVQEAAALQTFPSEWVFAGPQSSQFRQIGNAVPPVLAEVVAGAVVRAMSAHLSGSSKEMGLAA